MATESIPAPRSPEEVVRELRSGGPALVALSGGIDSGVVALLTREALGPDAIAVTLVGPAVSDSEREMARVAARAAGIDHEELTADPLTLAAYRQNPPNRCYFCRKVETEELLTFGRRRGIRQYLDGIHRDDLGEDRPGLTALEEAGFAHPLLRAGWGKSRVREFARERGLPHWDRPSNACLASRIAHGREISSDLLGRIDRAEAVVRGHGFRRVRVRVDGPAVRVEVDPEEVDRLLGPAIADSVQSALRALGFANVTLDRRGYAVRRGG
ncbi:MAG: ATP-dependent sacrificial sulfur transferase LarE [Thermoplasmata archaeon]